MGAAAYLRDLGRSRRDLAAPDPQIAVRWAEDTCSTAVGSGDHAGTVGDMQGGLGVSIGAVAGLVFRTGETAAWQCLAAVFSESTHEDPLKLGMHAGQVVRRPQVKFEVRGKGMK